MSKLNPKQAEDIIKFSVEIYEIENRKSMLIL